MSKLLAIWVFKKWFYNIFFNSIVYIKFIPFALKILFYGNMIRLLKKSLCWKLTLVHPPFKFSHTKINSLFYKEINPHSCNVISCSLWEETCNSVFPLLKDDTNSEVCLFFLHDDIDNNCTHTVLTLKISTIKVF